MAPEGADVRIDGSLIAYKASNQANDARRRLTMATNAGDTAAYDLANPTATRPCTATSSGGPSPASVLRD